MNQVQLGRTGLKVSRLCLGTMTFADQADETESRAILDAAANAGVNFIDTANAYPMGSKGAALGDSEKILGRWLKGQREQFILATKAGMRMGDLPWQSGTSRKSVLWAIDESLNRLQTDYVDLFQLHLDDRDTPLDESLEVLDTIVRSGRARYVGISNWPAWRIARALGRCEALNLAKPVTVQPRYNLLFRQFERDLFPMCQHEGLATLCYNPLAGGLLTGKHRNPASPDAGSRFDSTASAATYRDRYWHEREFRAIDRFMGVAQQVGIPPAQLAVAWVLAQSGVTCAIVGASRAAQLQGTLAAEDVVLSEETLSRLDEVTREFRMGDSER